MRREMKEVEEIPKTTPSEGVDTITGIVVRSQAGFFTIDTEDGQITARLRGRFKQGKRTGDLIAVGDRVSVSIQPDETAMIEEVEERRSKISRLAPTPRGEYEQIIIANLDQAILTFSCEDPPPNFRMLDRFLIITEEQGIPAVIVANKIDLVGKRGAKKMFGHYHKLGYPVVYTSAKNGKGIRKLRKILHKKLSVFAGPSGAGKSSLLNAVQPALGLQVSPSSRQSRLTRFLFSATPSHSGWASRCQRAFRQPHAGCLPATARKAARSCISSKPMSGFFLRNADRFWPRSAHAKRSEAPNFSTAMRTARRRGSGLRIFPWPPR